MTMTSFMKCVFLAIGSCNLVILSYSLRFNPPPGCPPGVVVMWGGGGDSPC